MQPMTWRQSVCVILAIIVAGWLQIVTGQTTIADTAIGPDIRRIYIDNERMPELEICVQPLPSDDDPTPKHQCYPVDELINAIEQVRAKGEPQ